MLQIPGVVDMYDRSEAKDIVEKLVVIYKELFETTKEIHVINKNIAMMNFVTQMNIPLDSVIDLTTLAFDVKSDAGESF
jgi:hypothetical protein